MRRLLAATVGFPLGDFLRGTHTLAAYHRDLLFLHESPEGQEARQWSLLKPLLQHAFRSVPYYRRRFAEEGVRVEELSGTRDLRHIPLLKRRDLQAGREALLANGAPRKRLEKGSSSGSTGEPVVFFKDSQAESEGAAANWVGWRFAGWEPGEPYFHVWGNPTTVGKWKRHSSRIKTWLWNWDRYPAHELQSDETLAELKTRIERFGPAFIGGYAHALFQLALHSSGSGGLKGAPLRGVFTTAEQLHAFQRKVIEEQIGPVFDYYGCAEISGVASQCALRQGYHVHAYHVIVEVVREDGLNKLVLTDLHNRAFPLIRYVVGDLATVPGLEEGCACGVTLPKIPGILGRESDVIPTGEGGAYLVPSFLGGKIFDRIGGVRMHQVVLKADGCFLVRLVMNRPLAEEERAELGSYLDDFLKGKAWRIEFLEDESQLTLHAGKFKIFYREVSC